MWGIGVSAGVDISNNQTRAEENQRRKEFSDWVNGSPESSPGSSPKKEPHFLQWLVDGFFPEKEEKHMRSPQAYAEWLQKEALKKPKV